MEINFITSPLRELNPSVRRTMMKKCHPKGWHFSLESKKEVGWTDCPSVGVIIAHLEMRVIFAEIAVSPMRYWW